METYKVTISTDNREVAEIVAGCLRYGAIMAGWGKATVPFEPTAEALQEAARVLRQGYEVMRSEVLAGQGLEATAASEARG